ncbi:uncharacterized protein V6R79_020539 [Siganus canaliculatus]
MMEDIDINDTTSVLLEPGVSEDSVDIYDGLDMGLSNSAENSTPSASQLRDSMDLYEEIVTEEQQNKESAFSELKSRFQAAQNQIKELRRRLDTMEIQNTGLNTENNRLKKNICALLQTARQEVTRKDAEIQRLSQWAEKRHYHHQTHRQPSSSSRISTGSCKMPLHPQPPAPLPPPPPSSPPPAPPPLPALPPREDRPQREPSQLLRKGSDSCQSSGSCIDIRQSKTSSYRLSKGSSRGDCDLPDKHSDHSVRKSSSSSSLRLSESDKHKSTNHREEKGPSQKLCESTDKRHRAGSDSNKDSHSSEKNRTHKADRDAGRIHDSRPCKSRTSDAHHRSERAKSPADRKGASRERRQDKAKMSTSDSEHNTPHTSKEDSNREHRKIMSSDGHRSSDSKERKRSSSNKHTEYHSSSSKEREVARPSKDHQRKEDRRHEEEVNRKHKKSREGEKQRSKESHVCSKDNKERTQDNLKTSKKLVEVSNSTEKSSVEENSPNRKLCFMETLNLTLSPIKKPVQGDLPAVNKLSDDEHDEESSQPNVDDMCVIDELNSSELEAASEDVAGLPPHLPKTPGTGTTQRCDATDGKGDGKKTNECPALANKPGDLSQQNVNKSLDTTEGQLTVHLAKKSSEKSALKAPKNLDKNKKKNEEEEECGPSKSTDGVGDASGSRIEQPCKSLEKIGPGNKAADPDPAPAPILLDSSVELKHITPKTAGSESLPLESVKDGPALSAFRKTSPAEDSTDKTLQSLPPALPQDSPQGPCPPASSSVHEKSACHTHDGPKEADAVSSTINLDSVPQDGVSLPEAIYMLTQAEEEDSDGAGITAEPSSSTGCIAVSKVSSTTEETALPQSTDLTVTPSKNYSPGKSSENNVEPSSSMPLIHDEDSMIRTLSNLKRIPDVISPLRSPARISKRSYLHINGKPGHVKSLQKEFSSSAADVSSKKLDVNKENKQPGSPAKRDPQKLVDKVSEPPSSLSDTELEEGEILSESDETTGESPAPASKRLKLTGPARAKPKRVSESPKTVLKRPSKELCVVSKMATESAGTLARSPKSRFKTVCPAATKASFSSIEDIMETFKLVRAEIRKKYMKLHKTFPRKSFYGVMDNFQESFMEFVDGAHFGQISEQEEELKSKLKKLITSVFSKVSNNGIVKRIFEQQAVDLKQKLWDFVNVQVDYLFRDIYTTLKSLCKSAQIRVQAEETVPGSERGSKQPPPKKPQCQQKEAQSTPPSLSQIKPCTVVPYRTGLGSRGKDIRITHMEKDRNVDPHKPVGDLVPTKNVPSSPEKNNMSALVVPQSGSLLDKTDFELLTEQQASSLTFNLVRDTQMGEIFKCLLQGSDLLESSGIAGDSTSWSLGTPRKDGERLISITTPSKFDSPSKLLSPTKFETPSKLIATWSSISPRKLTSPRSKDQMLLNPALFDESCLLEVPDNKGTQQSSLASQRSYSILAEDLAVSLTIPSPLKSDSHLSFLQPSRTHVLSTPDSVISAHISEDALLDGEDATEQDIHLALDTDNSSCGGSSSSLSEPLATPFVYRPDLPMKALVMEKSNDHFIVKICQAARNPAGSSLTTEDGVSQRVTERDQSHKEDELKSSSPSHAAPSENKLLALTESSQSAPSSNVHLSPQNSSTLKKDAQETASPHNTPNTRFSEESQQLNLHQTPASDQSLHSSSERSVTLSPSASRDGTAVTADEDAAQRGSQALASVLTAAGEDSSSAPENAKKDKGSKRKRHQKTLKAKRNRKEEDDSAQEVGSTDKKEESESKSSPASLSPNSLYAKNIIRKKGEVVMSWTRDEDRAILIDLKKKGASRETFSALAERLKKPSEQIAHRFHQLMKLFKKQEKMDV